MAKNLWQVFEDSLSDVEKLRFRLLVVTWILSPIAVWIYRWIRYWLRETRMILPELPQSTPLWVAIVMGFVVLGIVIRWLLSRIRELEYRITPKVKIHSPEIVGDGHIARFKITNLSTTDLDNCLVKLESIRTVGGERRVDAVLPIGLATVQQMFQQNAGEDRRGGRFNLRGDESKQIHIAGLDPTRQQLQFSYESKAVREAVAPVPFEPSEYDLEIGVYGVKSRSIRLTYRLNVVKTGLIIEETFNDQEYRDHSDLRRENRGRPSGRIYGSTI